jgi:hypothetical protein
MTWVGSFSQAAPQDKTRQKRLVCHWNVRSCMMYHFLWKKSNQIEKQHDPAGAR